MYTYPVCVLVIVAYSIPRCYEEPRWSEGWKVIGEHISYVVSGMDQQTLICGLSVVDRASINWSSVYISPVG